MDSAITSDDCLSMERT